MKAFKTESKKLLDLMINSIYTNHDVFLRELISNASDALDKAHLQEATADNPHIHVAIDQERRLLTVSDNGIGMDAEALERCLGTIAHSDSYLAKQEETGDVDIIGQFGVGFYSAFMVADDVQVVSRALGEDAAYCWKSNGVDGYSISEAERDEAGTDVVLHIRPSTPENNFERFLDQATIVALIRRYSNYIRYPITMNLAEEHFDEQTGELIRNEANAHCETINSMTPIWALPEDEVSDDDLSAFYCSEFHDPEKPLLTIRANARGAIQYDALLFIPANAPAELYSKDFKYGPTLYSANVLIEDCCSSLVPSYLRFVCGIVDVKGANLNVSREAMQEDARIQIIQRQLEQRVLGALRDLQKNDRAHYETFFDAYGTGLKFSLTSAQGSLNEVLADLLLYPSARKNALISLQDYLDSAKPSKQPEIYYATGNNADHIRQSPAVEALLERDYDVLLCPAAAQDELCFMVLGHFRGARFVSTSSANLPAEEDSSEPAPLSDDVMHTLYALYKTSPYPLARVTPSRYLTKPDQPASRIATQAGLSISMAKYLNSKMATEGTAHPIFILEVNTESSLYTIARAAVQQGDTKTIEACALVLLGQAFLAEDIALPDAPAFNQAVCYLLSQSH